MSLDDALYVLSITAVLTLLDGTLAVWSVALSMRMLRAVDVVLALPALGLLSLGFVAWGPHEFLAVMPLKRVEIWARASRGEWEFTYLPWGAQESGSLTLPLDVTVHLTVRSDTERRQLYIPSLRMRVDVGPGEEESVWFTARELTREDASLPYYDRHHAPDAYHVDQRTVHVVSLDDYWAYVGPSDDAHPCESDSRFGENLMACWGEQLATQMGCMGCHPLDGPGMAPPLRGLWGRTTTLTDGTTRVVDEAYFTRALREPGADIAAGYTQATMPPYNPTSNRLVALSEYVQWLADPTRTGAKDHFETPVCWAGPHEPLPVKPTGTR